MKKMILLAASAAFFVSGVRAADVIPNHVRHPLHTAAVKLLAPKSVVRMGATNAAVATDAAPTHAPGGLAGNNFIMGLSWTPYLSDTATYADNSVQQADIGTTVAGLDSNLNVTAPVAGSVTQATAQAANGLATASLATRFSRILDVVNDGGAKCDGSTDDSTAISSLLTKASNNAVVRIPAGLTCRAKSIIVPAYSHLTIDGTLKAVDAADAQLISIDTKSYVTIDGIGTIDGNSSSYPSTDTGVYACVNANGTSYFVLEGVTVQNCKNYPVNIWNSAAHDYVSHVRLLDSGNSPECAKNVDDCWVDHAYISGIKDVGWSFYNGVTNSGITNSRSTLNTGAGFTSYQDGNPTNPNSNILFANNIADHNGGPGFMDIGVETNGATSRHQHISFIGNIGSYNNNTIGQSGYGCITIVSGYYYTIVGNQCSYDGANGVQVFGIWAQNQVYNATIADNIIFNEGQGGALGAGIWLSSTAYYMNVHDNSIFDDQGTHTMAYGVAGSSSAGSGTRIHHNYYRALLGGAGLSNYVAADDTIIDEAAIQRVSASGTAITAARYATWIYLYQTTTIASQTITLPAYGGNGQTVVISSAGAITTLTVNAATGATVLGAPVALAAGSSISFRFDGSSATWVRVQ